jgi:outer membrane protein
MNRKIWIVLLLLIISIPEMQAQKKWTLEECIDYALTNNIGLQRQKLQSEIDKTNLTKSRMGMLPNLNFGSDVNVGFGRSIDPVTNLITFEQNISNSFSLVSNVSVFNGFASINTIAANKFMLKAGLEAEKVERNTLVVSILGAYYQALYAKGLEDAAALQADLSEKQLFRIQKTVEAGREALSRKYEMESRLSEDKLSYTIAKNNASKAVTDLKQLLQIEPGTEFEILLPELDDIIISNEPIETDSIYNIASQTLPRLKAINYELIASRKQLAAARGTLAPSLTLGGAIYTGFYKILSGAASEQDPYSRQLKNNNSQAVYVSLQVPIFNRYTSGRNIKLAKINRNDTQLRLELEKNSLYSEIENACLNISRGQDEYAAARANLEFNKKSFDAVEKKFETGLVDVTDYSAAKTTLFKAETEAIRTKLQMLIRRLTIQFYCTGEYETLVKN